MELLLKQSLPRFSSIRSLHSRGCQCKAYAKKIMAASTDRKDHSLLQNPRQYNGVRDYCEVIRDSARQRLYPYRPPEWAKRLKEIPKWKIDMSMTNTPIHRWYIPGIPDDFEVYIKRDDLTGCSLSGNKARKLNFLLADALDKNCDTLLGCGAVQSNFCRALAAGGKELGFDVNLFQRSRTKDPTALSMQGNPFINQMLGATVYLVPIKSNQENHLLPRMERLADYLRKKHNRTPYIIPVGGSSTVGLFGHIDCFDELINQSVLEDFSDMVMAIGSGGSAAGFSIGNHFNGNKLKIHCMAVCDDASYFHGVINGLLKSTGLQGDGTSVRSEESVNIVEGVKGRGYGLSTDEEREFILQTAATTGIILDPVYTGKAAYHMVKRIQTAPESFKGKKILFYHSGSPLGLMDGTMSEMLRGDKSFHKCYDWMTMDDFPLDE